jgi:phosphonate degradation associated HDIG domain protein
MSLNNDNIVEFLLDIFERRGADSYLGEDVTMSEHMLQCAECAAADGADPELIAAALIHDIGHYTNEFPDDAREQGIDNHHDSAGGGILAGFFSERISECVRLHVLAKRYLCAVEADYFSKLSPASVHTLYLQGGSMSKVEIDEFTANPYHQDAVRVRRWDEAGKVKGVETRSIQDFAPLLKSLLA